MDTQSVVPYIISNSPLSSPTSPLHPKVHSHLIWLLLQLVDNPGPSFSAFSVFYSTFPSAPRPESSDMLVHSTISDLITTYKNISPDLYYTLSCCSSSSNLLSTSQDNFEIFGKNDCDKLSHAWKQVWEANEWILAVTVLVTGPHGMGNWITCEEVVEQIERNRAEDLTIRRWLGRDLRMRVITRSARR